jgi:hypothetical protein
VKERGAQKLSGAATALPSYRLTVRYAGVAQLVEHQPSKLRVAGSSPVARLAAKGGRYVGTKVTEGFPEGRALLA